MQLARPPHAAVSKAASVLSSAKQQLSITRRSRCLRLRAGRRQPAQSAQSNQTDEKGKADDVIRRVLRQFEEEGRGEEYTRLRRLFGLDSREEPVELTDDEVYADGIFDWEAYNSKWQVPWGLGRTAAGAALWAGSFLATGVVLVPVLAYALKIPGLLGGAAEDKALLALFNQVLETVVGLGVIALVVQKSRPLPPDLFNFSPADPFRKPDGWLRWGLTGVALSPVVVFMVASLVALTDLQESGGRGTVDSISGIIDVTPITYASLLTVTSVLAPLLEETVFRGFLLTSLTKFMPTPSAVVISSLAFGAAHLSARDFPQLTALGLVMGFAYVRSRNLLTPMLIHATWNGTVLTILFLLTASGVDIQELLAAGQ